MTFVQQVKILTHLPHCYHACNNVALVMRIKPPFHYPKLQLFNLLTNEKADDNTCDYTLF